MAIKITRYSTLSILLIYTFVSNSYTQVIRCFTDSLIREEHTNESIEPDWSILRDEGITFRSVITIPVVVHVVSRNDDENIPDSQIYSQIEILNQDFRAINDNISIVPDEFASFIADVEIEFCLASVDPCGNSTNGITRTNTTSFIGVTRDIFYNERGGKNAWDTKKYLNIWVANLGNILGYASSPNVFSEEEDGVVINYRYFGKVEDSYPFHLGRTTTHELGHYFNLEHIWGNGNCSQDDGIEDTPNQDTSYDSECPNIPQFSCGSSDMYMNYMNYTDDACMGMFTLGQKQKILATIQTYRKGLTESSGCQSDNLQSHNNATIFPNPSEGFINVEFVDHASCLRDFFLFDIKGKLLKKGVVSNEVSVDARELPTGTYLLQILSDSRLITKKVVILR